MSRILACRSCGSSRLHVILSLTPPPLANLFAAHRRAELHEPEDRFPLDLVLCSNCSLVQLTEDVPPERLFRDYLYQSSFSDTMTLHVKHSAERLICDRRLGTDSLVVEIGSNDGYLLRHFAAAGVPVLGIDPARNVAQVARTRGVPTISEFFGGPLAEELVAEGRSADVILANNVMAHVPDISGVAAGVAKLLKHDGIFVMETPYVRELIDRVEFDTIYHEHLFYYSLTALDALFRRHDLIVADVERIAIHGGSLRVSVAHAQSSVPSPAVNALLQQEAAWGVTTPEAYAGFGEQVDSLIHNLRSTLQGLKRGGNRIAGYGASAKGEHVAELCGGRARVARLRRRPQPCQAGTIHTRQPPADPRAG